MTGLSKDRARALAHAFSMVINAQLCLREEAGATERMDAAFTYRDQAIENLAHELWLASCETQEARS